MIRLLLFAVAVCAAAEPVDLLEHVWPAQWIDVPGTSPQDYGVYHFRRTFDLTEAPARFVVHVSGDNRYELYVNGTLVSWGPARADLYHWRYETVDVASQLHAGRNSFAAVVWNDGPGRAVAQVSNQTGFLLQADNAASIDSNAEWKCLRDEAYSAQPPAPGDVTEYYVAPPNERVDARRYPWGWQDTGYNDSGWPNARVLSAAAPRDAQDAPNRWMLVPRPIPLEERTPQRIPKVRLAEGVNTPAGFPQGPAALTIPEHQHVRLLLDQTYLTTAWPEITVSSGSGSSVTLRYAEALYGKGWTKGNRNQIEGRQFHGPADTYIADGGPHRVWRPLFWRTWRYVRLEIETADEPLTIEDVRGIYTGYPFEQRASFHAEGSSLEDGEIQRILAAGWRTARLCAHETYMDCPFYEQLQYGGDARVQMLVSLYMTGDARLMKNGIELLDDSRTSEGATYSRAPSRLQQYIPPFSLWWVGMVHDYWMYVDDPEFVRRMLPGVRAVLSFFANYQKPNGSLRKLPWWNYADWVNSWKSGVPPASADGSSSSVLDLQLLLAYYWSADLEGALGEKWFADRDSAKAAVLKSTILLQDWDAGKGLFADQPEHLSYSQQANTLALLAHIVPPPQARAIAGKMLADGFLTQSSIYFRAYTNGVLREAGLGDRYLEMLGPWRHMLADGLTTWSEIEGDSTRSDCHAWGASPNYEFLRTVAGIEPAAAGFRRVRVAPNMNNLERITAAMPHPKGEIRVDLRRRAGRLAGEIDLPPRTPGEFHWHEWSQELTPGENRIDIAEK
jgi:alpha-L-rhamnosidase